MMHSAAGLVFPRKYASVDETVLQGLLGNISYDRKKDKLHISIVE